MKKVDGIYGWRGELVGCDYSIIDKLWVVFI